MIDKTEIEISESDDVLKELGALSAATEALESELEDCDEKAESLGHWITTIGRAILAIFK